MKNKPYVNLLPLLIGSLGIACSVTRLGLYLLATDNKGLLIPSHPLALFSWVLTAIAVVLSFSMARMLKGSNHYCANFQPSAAAAIGSFVMAGGILLAVVCGWGSPMMLDRVCSIAGILSVPAIIAAGIQRYLGKKPFFLFYALRYGFAPAKIYAMACRAFAGDFDEETIKKWLRNFYRRFFTQQFKRNCMPDGVKVGTVGLGPRGDWSMPSDASARLWLEEAEKL